MTLAVPVENRKLQEARSAPGGAGQSRARLVCNDKDALAVRLALIASAAQSVDLQYYYWAPDLSGGIMMAAVLQAADRGVKVRILLDDFNAGGLDGSFSALDTHPNVAVRLFNPLRFRLNGVLRMIDFLSTFVAANNRMHNKNLIVDRRHAVVGGRNLGDPYFGLDRGTNFHDIDMHVEGQGAAAAAAIFDAYWTATASRRVSRLIGRSPSKLARLRTQLRAMESSADAQELLREVSRFVDAERQHNLHHVDILDISADPPAKAVLRERPDWVGPRIEALIASARREVVLLSPYFIPGTDGCELLERVAARGVTVKVLTNSLAATDVVIAHSGYARYRRRLLAAGLELYEQPATMPREKIRVFGSRKASLHTKSVLVDRGKGFLGSFNFDPRSRSINTEMGLFFEDEGLGDTLGRELDRHLAQCLRVSVQDEEMVWSDAVGNVVSRAAEPLAGPGRRLIASVAGALPLESQL